MSNWYDFLSNVDWGGAAQKVLPAVVSNYVVGNANTNAANTVQGANNAASAAEIAARNAAIARLNPTIQTTQPAIGYLRGVMADTNLTPQQQQYIEDTRRNTGQALQSSLGGRAATAIATKAANEVQGNVYQANRARADQAAGTVANMNMNATNAANAIDTGTAGNVAAATRATGETIGASQLGTGAMQARTIGNVLAPNPTQAYTDAISKFSAPQTPPTPQPTSPNFMDSIRQNYVDTTGRKATY